MKKSVIIIITSVVLTLTLLGLYIFVYEDPLRGTLAGKQYEPMMSVEDTLSYDQAKEDLDYLYSLIKTRHYSCLENNVPSNIKSAYDLEIASLKDSNSLFDVWKSVGRILHELDDGHAQSGYMYSDTPDIFDVKFQVVSENEWYIWLDGVKYQLVSLFNMPVSDIYQIAKDTFSYENIYYLNYLLERKLVYPIYETYFTGNLTQNGEVSYIDENSQIVNTNMDKVLETYDSSEAVTYSIDETNSVGKLIINQMVNDDASKQAFHDFFTEVKNDSIGTVVIDLQNNGGGNSVIIKELMTYFPMETYKDYGSSVRFRLFHIIHDPRIAKNDVNTDLAFNGETFLITSNRTFSSAAMLTGIFKDNDMGLIYGEPMGNKPSMYGDILKYQLPNSGFPVTLTYKFFTRPNGNVLDDTIMPDVIVEPSDAYQAILDDIS